MSIFQCSKCGCIENTSCTGGYWMSFHNAPEDVLESYRQVLGLNPGEEFGVYCNVCDPQWFTPDGKEYGKGPRPEGYKDRRNMGRHEGKWHGEFERRFLPKGKFHTNMDGNLAHVDTLETDYEKYILPEEDKTVNHTRHDVDLRLPRPDDKKACKEYLKKRKEKV